MCTEEEIIEINKYRDYLIVKGRKIDKWYKIQTWLFRFQITGLIIFLFFSAYLLYIGAHPFEYKLNILFAAIGSMPLGAVPLLFPKLFTYE